MTKSIYESSLKTFLICYSTSSIRQKFLNVDGRKSGFEQCLTCLLPGENYQESESQTSTLPMICPRKFYF